MASDRCRIKNAMQGYQYLDAELDSLPLTDWVYGEATLDMMLQGHPLQFSI